MAPLLNSLRGRHCLVWNQNKNPEHLHIVPMQDIFYLIASVLIRLSKCPVSWWRAGRLYSTCETHGGSSHRLRLNERWGWFHWRVPGEILHHHNAAGTHRVWAFEIQSAAASRRFFIFCSPVVFLVITPSGPIHHLYSGQGWEINLQWHIWCHIRKTVEAAPLQITPGLFCEMKCIKTIFKNVS